MSKISPARISLPWTTLTCRLPMEKRKSARRVAEVFGVSRDVGDGLPIGGEEGGDRCPLPRAD